ncbi:hypothetical protein HWI79_800 [Cryptosporidium felis]|nr:hypothetical protein HWI79_800 [Cryptosporidium felis]
MKREYKNKSSGMNDILHIPRSLEVELETVVTKRESREFPSLPNASFETKSNDSSALSYESLGLESIQDYSRLDSKGSTNKVDQIKYKTVWMGPGGGYSIMEEYVEPRKSLEREVPFEPGVKAKRCRQEGSCKNSKRMSNIAGNSSVEILRDANVLKEDNYVFRSSRTLVDVDWSKEDSAGPLPFQSKVAVGNRSRLGRNLVPL